MYQCVCVFVIPSSWFATASTSTIYLCYFGAMTRTRYTLQRITASTIKGLFYIWIQFIPFQQTLAYIWILITEPMKHGTSIQFSAFPASTNIYQQTKNLTCFLILTSIQCRSLRNFTEKSIRVNCEVERN